MPQSDFLLYLQGKVDSLACMKHLRLLLLPLVLHAVLGAAPTVDTVAGTGQPELNLHDGPVDKVNIKDPFGVEFGPDGRLYVTEVGHHRILAADLKTSQVETVAGTGQSGYSGDGGPASKAKLNEPYEIRFDRAGNLYWVEMQNHVVRRMDAESGLVRTLAGTGKPGDTGDGGPAREATFNRPHSIALDEARGHLYIADIGNHRIRRVDLKTGRLTGYAGNGKKTLPKPGQKVGPEVPMIGPRALYITPGTLWIALREGHSVWKVDLGTRIITPIAGTGRKGFTGDGGPALEGTFKGPKGIVVDSKEENVYVVDTENQALRRIHLPTGRLSSLAGYGPKGRGYNGEGVPAAKAKFGRPHGICIGPDGAVYTGDTLNHRVRRVRW